MEGMIIASATSLEVVNFCGCRARLRACRSLADVASDYLTVVG